MVIDKQASPVLRAVTATRIEQARSRKGLLHEFYHAMKSSLLPAQPSAEPYPPTTLAAATAQCPSTSGWDDAGERNEDYIDAKHAAEAVKFNYKNYAWWELETLITTEIFLHSYRFTWAYLNDTPKFLATCMLCANSELFSHKIKVVLQYETIF